MGARARGDMVTELDRCRPWIEAALEHDAGTHTIDDVLAEIEAGRMQLWPAPDGCVVTEIVTYPRKRVVNICYAGGTLAQIMDMVPSIKAWAQAQGCDSATMRGRPGWLRVLRDWRHLHTVMELNLNG